MKPVHLTLSFLGHLVFLVLLGTASTLLKQAPPPPPDTIRISFGELPRAAGGRKREARGTKTIPAPREEPKPKPATPPKETPKPKATLPAPKEQPKPPAAKPAEAVKPVTKAQAEKTPPTAVPKPAPGLAGATGAAASGAKEGAAVPAPGAAEEGPGAQAVGAGASVQARGDLGAGDSYLGLGPEQDRPALAAQRREHGGAARPGGHRQLPHQCERRDPGADDLPGERPLGLRSRGPARGGRGQPPAGPTRAFPHRRPQHPVQFHLPPLSAIGEGMRRHLKHPGRTGLSPLALLLAALAATGLLAFVQGLGVLPAAAQGGGKPDEVIRLGVERTSVPRVRVKLLPLEVLAGESGAGQAAAAMAGRLARDLYYSGLIEISLPLPAGVSSPYPNGRSARPEEAGTAEYAIGLRLETAPATGLVWVARLVEPDGAVRVSKRYTVALPDFARSVHHFADEVVMQLTGEQGIAADARPLHPRQGGPARALRR